MNLLPPPAPSRRHVDTWRAWIPGSLIIGAALGLHALKLIPNEHVILGLVALGAKRLPQGRLRDSKRWKLATDTRTDERETG